MQYEVFRDLDSDVNGATRLNGFGSITTRYTDSSLQAGTTYYYWIKVTDTSNVVTYSQAISGKLATAAAAQTTTTTQTTSSSNSIAGNYKITNKFSGRVLDVVGNSYNTSAQIQQYDYNGNSNQKWGVAYDNGSNLMIYALSSNQCLDIPSGTANNGTNVQQYTCSHQANQNWRLLDSGNGFYQIQNVASGKCLEVANWNGNNGTRITQNDCNNTDNKLWRLDRI